MEAPKKMIKFKPKNAGCDNKSRLNPPKNPSSNNVSSFIGARTTINNNRSSKLGTGHGPKIGGSKPNCKVSKTNTTTKYFNISIILAVRLLEKLRAAGVVGRLT